MQPNSERHLPLHVRWIYHFYWKPSELGWVGVWRNGAVVLGWSVGGQLAKAGCQPAPDSDLSCHLCGDCQFFLNANVRWSPVILELQHKSVHTVNLTPKSKAKKPTLPLLPLLSAALQCSCHILAWVHSSSAPVGIVQYPTVVRLKQGFKRRKVKYFLEKKPLNVCYTDSALLISFL